MFLDYICTLYKLLHIVASHVIQWNLHYDIISNLMKNYLTDNTLEAKTILFLAAKIMNNLIIYAKQKLGECNSRLSYVAI